MFILRPPAPPSAGDTVNKRRVPRRVGKQGPLPLLLRVTSGEVFLPWNQAVARRTNLVTEIKENTGLGEGRRGNEALVFSKLAASQLALRGRRRGRELIAFSASTSFEFSSLSISFFLFSVIGRSIEECIFIYKFRNDSNYFSERGNVLFHIFIPSPSVTFIFITCARSFDKW